MLEAGTRLGRYEIRSKIGAGGMGEVYLADDTRLHRKVALKILPTDLAANQDRMRRFEQEAQAAAALNHPNIAHIYEIGESDATNFIAMEFVDGVTLREKIHQERTELRKLLRFLQHAAEGLAKAHAVYYRDPDGNRMEFQVDCCANADEAHAFMHSDAFAANPVGVEIDPDALLAQYRSGVSMETLMVQPE